MIGLDFEERARANGHRIIAGIDEVGRGCLAGAVVAGAVVLDPAKPLPEGLNDSKKLSKKRREAIAHELRESAFSWSVGMAEAEEIDETNILQATKEAMARAISGLDPEPDFLLIDGYPVKRLELPQQAIIKGDSVSASIAAASIIAKVYRDKLMSELDLVYPEYGFAKHAGYGTKAHFEALRRHGACPIHRKSFKGVVEGPLFSEQH